MVHVLKTRFDEFIERKFLQANDVQAALLLVADKLQKQQQQQDMLLDKLLDKLLKTLLATVTKLMTNSTDARYETLSSRVQTMWMTRKSRSVVKFKYARQFAFSFASLSPRPHLEFWRIAAGDRSHACGRNVTSSFDPFSALPFSAFIVLGWYLFLTLSGSCRSGFHVSSLRSVWLVPLPHGHCYATWSLLHCM